MSWGTTDRPGTFAEAEHEAKEYKLHESLSGNVKAMDIQLVVARKALLAALAEVRAIAAEGDYKVSVHMGGHAHEPRHDSAHEFINVSITLSRVVTL